MNGYVPQIQPRGLTQVGSGDGGEAAPAEVSVLTAQAHADEQSHVMWALTGHVQRQQQELAAQQHRLRQIQER